MSTIVLAYSGGLASSVAAHRFAQEPGTEVVAVTLDLGQGDDLNALRARAMACGAVRAHVVDAREQFVRECLLPSLGRGPLDAQVTNVDVLAYPIIARNLIEIAAIEGAPTVAHAATNLALDEAIFAIDPAARVKAPAREVGLDERAMVAYARAHGLSGGHGERSCRVDQNLWGRSVSFPQGEKPAMEAARRAAADPTEAAHLAISFERGVPMAINGVPMAPVELVESLALIAGRHGVGRFERVVGGRTIVYDAPAAVVLQAARAHAGETSVVVRMTALNGLLTVIELDTELVNHA